MTLGGFAQLSCTCAVLRRLVELQRLATHRLANLVHEGKETQVTGKEPIN